MTHNTGTPAVAALIQGAAADHRGVGAFNVVTLEHAESIVAGAERSGLPAILQISENCIRYHGTARPLIAACRAMARAASVPAFVHLDHIRTRELIDEGIEAGVDSVMYDGSTLPYDQNVATTAAVASQCHAAGIGVEAELGEIGGKDGVHTAGVRTDPDQAREFARATGIDMLAVAVGTSHAMTSRTAMIDHDLIERLAAAVPVPLVLHGSSGVSDNDLVTAVTAGISKINIATHLNKMFTTVIRRTLDNDADTTDPRKYLAPAREATATEVARLQRIFDPIGDTRRIMFQTR